MMEENPTQQTQDLLRTIKLTKNVFKLTLPSSDYGPQANYQTMPPVQQSSISRKASIDKHHTRMSKSIDNDDPTTVNLINQQQQSEISKPKPPKIKRVRQDSAENSSPEKAPDGGESRTIKRKESSLNAVSSQRVGSQAN